jgi:hypothetical protein
MSFGDYQQLPAASPIMQASSAGGGSFIGVNNTTMGYCDNFGGWYYPAGNWWVYPWYVPYPVAVPCAPVAMPPRIQAALEAMKLPNTKANAKIIATARKLFAEYLDGKVFW